MARAGTSLFLNNVMRNFLSLPFLWFAATAFSQTYTATITVPGLLITNGIAVITIGTPKKISDYPNRPIPNDTDLFALADAVNHTNANVNYGQLRADISASIPANGLPYMTWSGPSNSVPLGPTNYLWYVAYTPCAVTGFTYNNALENFGLLSILNNSGSNITFTTIALGPQEDASHTYTVTNGFVLKSWMEFSHGFTNHVTRVFKAS